MKFTRKQIRILLEQEEENNTDLTDEKRKEVDDAVAEYLAAEGGAAAEKETEDIVSKKIPGIDPKKYLKKNPRFDQLKPGGQPQDYYDKNLTETLSRKMLRQLIKEELKRLSYVSKEQGHTYGIEHLPDRFDQKKADDIIGHT